MNHHEQERFDGLYSKHLQALKLQGRGLSFFYRHVLGRKMEWIEIINPPKARSLPDVPTREEVQSPRPQQWCNSPDTPTPA
jgi:hypothetical protein